MTYGCAKNGDHLIILTLHLERQTIFNFWMKCMVLCILHNQFNKNIVEMSVASLPFKNKKKKKRV